MTSSWFDPEIAGFCVLGLGGSLLGLAHLLGGRATQGRLGRAVDLAFVVLLAGTAGAALVWGRAHGVWIPLVLLAGLWGTVWVLGRPPGGASPGWGTALAARARSPHWQGAALFLLSVGAAFGWAFHLDKPFAKPDMLGDEEPAADGSTATLEVVATPHVHTDRGRAVCLYRAVPRGRATTATGPKHPAGRWEADRTLLRTGPVDRHYNCHGWTFAGGKYWLKSDEVGRILADNGYRQVTEPAVGDVIIYRDAVGTIVHSGVVRAVGGGDPVLIESKWGPLGRFIHFPDRWQSGGVYHYYRSDRGVHLLAGLDGDGRTGTLATSSASAGAGHGAGGG